VIYLLELAKADRRIPRLPLHPQMDPDPSISSRISADPKPDSSSNPHLPHVLRCGGPFWSQSNSNLDLPPNSSIGHGGVFPLLSLGLIASKSPPMIGDLLSAVLNPPPSGIASQTPLPMRHLQIHRSRSHRRCLWRTASTPDCQCDRRGTRKLCRGAVTDDSRRAHGEGEGESVECRGDVAAAPRRSQADGGGEAGATP
jgi:hypothetical protein